MASIAKEISGNDDHLHLPSAEKEDADDYTHLPSEEEEEEEDQKKEEEEEEEEAGEEEEEEDNHEYLRPEDLMTFVLSIDLASYTLADIVEAQDAAASTAAVTPSISVVCSSDDSELAGAVAEALEEVEVPSDGRDCPICLQGDDTSAAWKETRCGHQFHGRCVERWLQAKGSCPMCRSQVVTMPTAAATSNALEIERSVILEFYGQVIANSALPEE